MEIAAEVVSLSAILDAVKELKRFASDKSEEIEEFYRYSGPNRLWVHVSIWKNGNYDHISFPDAQYNAFHVAATIYHEFAHWGEYDSLMDKLEEMTQKVEKLPIELESTAPAKIKEAREKGLTSIQMAILPDQFYPSYQRFVQKLAWLTDNISKIPDDPTLWQKELESIFIKHARYLIKEGPVTPKIFDMALEEVVNHKKPLEVFNSKNQHRLPNDVQIDIDYLYDLTQVCSVWTRSGSVVVKGNKTEVLWKKFSEQELVKKLRVYLVKLWHKDVIDQFHTIFNATYLAEVNYPQAERAVHARHSNEEQNPWTLTQFWSDEQRNHRKKMVSVLSEICSSSANDEKTDQNENSADRNNQSNH